jgi:hypothetical protein
MNIYSIRVFSLFCITLLLISGCGGGDSSSSSDSQVGQAGSMARFTIQNDYLYTISGPNLQLFDITEPSDPQPFAKVGVAWDIETIFSYQQALFIGGQQGVYIFDNSDPSNPQQVSEFTHGNSCDPVVVSNDVAYITLRSGNRCFRGTNVLDILDVSDIFNPQLVKTVAMQNPKGLGTDENRLFVCDGIAGLKTFDLADPLNPGLIGSETDLDCFDLIANNGLLIVSDNSGILQYQYNFSDADLTLLSSLLVDG